MDRAVQVEVLRRHSHYVGTLVSQLTDTLTQLAQVLSAPGPPAAETAGLLAQCAALESRLRVETDLLVQRLHFFVEDTQSSPDAL